MSIREHYINAIRTVMREHKVSPAEGQPSHVVRPDSSFTEVLQYTEHFIGGGYQRARGWNEYYRFYRYINALNNALNILDTSQTLRSSQIVHIDVGCGPGLFAWALLDWASDKRISFDGVALYGYDQSDAMVNLARRIRYHLVKTTPTYPLPWYDSSISRIHTALANRRTHAACYVITFGYVLAGNNADSDIQSFTNCVQGILAASGEDNTYILLACDATRSGNFLLGWHKLEHVLEAEGISVRGIVKRQGECCALLS